MKSSNMSTTISKAAEQAGVGVETIRFYERKGLVEQPRRPPSGGFRHYPADTVARIRFIRQAQHLGFSLREIEELLALQADLATNCAEVRQQVQTKLSEVNHKITQLQQIQSVLEQLIKACPGQGALEGCPVIEALNRAEPTTPQADPVETHKRCIRAGNP